MDWWWRSNVFATINLQRLAEIKGEGKKLDFLNAKEKFLDRDSIRIIEPGWMPRENFLINGEKI